MEFLAKFFGGPHGDKRLRSVVIATGAYVVASLLLVLGHAAGLIGLPGMLASVALIAVVNVAFLAAFKLKFNERFADPGLMLAQTLAAIAAIMFVAFQFDRDRSLVLAWCLVVMLFGVFRFKPRDFGTTTLFMLAGYALVINLLMSLEAGQGRCLHRVVSVGVAGIAVAAVRMDRRAHRRDAGARHARQRGTDQCAEHHPGHGHARFPHRPAQPRLDDRRAPACRQQGAPYRREPGDLLHRPRRVQGCQ